MYEIYHLVNNDVVVVPGLYITKRIITKMRSMERGDGIAKCREGTANLSVATFAHGNAPGVIVIISEAVEFEFALTVRQHDAKVADHLAMKRLERVVERHLVNFGFMKLWMSHLERKIAVISEQQESRAISVEATNWFERVHIRRQERVNGFTIALFASRANIPYRFMKRHVTERRWCVERLTVDSHDVVEWMIACTE